MFCCTKGWARVWLHALLALACLCRGFAVHVHCCMPWLTSAQHLLAIVCLMVWPVVFQKKFVFHCATLLVRCEGLRQAGV